MGRKFLQIAVVVFVVSLVFTSVAFSQSKESLLAELNQAKENYYNSKYEIDNQVRILSRDWHENQLSMHAQIKADPTQARAIRAQIWEGAKELASKKQALYDQLTPLRKDWFNNRMSLESQIDDIEEAEAAERDQF